MPLVQVIIDDSTSKVITGQFAFDRANGGVLVVPAGSALPDPAVEGELFWLTTTGALYRRGASSWQLVQAALAAHASTHAPGASDSLALGSPVVVLPGAASDGTASAFARSDHQHGVGTAAPVAIGTANAEGSGNNLARSSHVHDHGAQSTATHHAVATTGANGFMSSVDKTKLDGVAAGATNTPLSSTAPVNVTKAGASAGTSSQASRQDHKHDVSTAVAVANPPGTANAEGISSSLARADHTHALHAYGNAVDTICQGNDARLSDDRTASGLRTATTTVAISAAVAPSAGQVLQAVSSTQAQWETPTGSIFGSDYQSGVSLGASSTTSTTFQTKVTVTTPSLTGTYRVGWSCRLRSGTANRRMESQMYNVTDAAVLGEVMITRPSATTVADRHSGFAEVTFTGASKTLALQWRSPDSASITIDDARVEFWRVA